MKFFLAAFFLLMPLLGSAQTDDDGPGRAIRFDGSSGHVDIGDRYNDLTFPFTISSWVYLDPGSNEISAIFASEDGSFPYRGFWLRVTKTNIGLGWGDGTGGNLGTYRRVKVADVPDFSGKWMHISAVAHADNDITLYLNGVELSSRWTGTSSLSMATNFSDLVSIGHMYTNYEHWQMNGFLDEIRLWDYARTAPEIKRDMCIKLSGGENGLVGYWNFNETSGSYAMDSSPNMYHGVRDGITEYPYSGAPIGDSSVFSYESVTDLFLAYKGDTIKITAVNGVPEGAHLYLVKNTDLESVECNAGYYFGLYSFTNSIQQADITLAVAKNKNLIFHRSDNSIRDWELMNLDNEPAFTVNRRVEFTPGGSTEFDLGTDLVLCTGTTFDLVPEDMPIGNYTWSDGSSGEKFTIDGDTLVWLELANNCTTFRDSIKVEYFDQPEVNLGPDLTFCPQDPFVLVPESSSGGDLKWMNGTSTPSFTVWTEGIIWAEIENGCATVRDSISIAHIPGPSFSISEKEYNCVELPMTISVPFPPEYITWSNGSSGNETTLDKIGEYVVRYDDGCYTHAETIHINSVNLENEFFIPNIITPNRDGYNESFIIDENLSGSSIRIFNRWGKTVFQQEAYDNSWTGYELNPGIYYYTVSNDCLSESIKGWVHLLK